jgi:hypothetical protein
MENLNFSPFAVVKSSINVQIKQRTDPSFFLASDLWVRGGFGRVHIPIMLRKGVSVLVSLQLSTCEVVLLDDAD